MLAKRIIPCLDVKNGKVVKGINFSNLVYAGDPVEQAIKYNAAGADELVFLDISATEEERKPILNIIQNIAKNIFIPLTVGGGIRTIEDIRQLLKGGADKVAINSAAVKNPELIIQAAKIFGSQCIVVAIDAKRTKFGWEVYIKSGKQATGLDALEWAKKVELLGAGEILITSMDKDGTKTGYDLELTKKIAELVNIPVIASGGAGELEDVFLAFNNGKADAAIVASLLHYGKYQISEIKDYLKNKNIPIRKEYTKNGNC